MADETQPRPYRPAMRLLWLPVFLAIVLLLPDPADPAHEQTALKSLRRRAVTEGILRAWDERLTADLAEALNSTPSRAERFRSFWQGDGALPEAPDQKVVFALGEVRDLSGADEPWTALHVRSLPLWSELAHLELAPLSPSTPIVDVDIRREGPEVVAWARLRDPSVSLGLMPPPAGVNLELGPPEETRLRFPRPGAMIPPLVAIFSALILRRALLSLILGVVAGGVVAAGGAGLVASGRFYWAPMTDEFRLAIILFVLFLVGMIGVVTRSGGTQGLVDLLTRRTRGRRSTRIITVLMGFLIFFDDYSNSVVVGSSMRPLTDRMKIAREKLAYLIDSTAAPIAGIALFSTWIGYEISQYQSALQAVDPTLTDRAYFYFLQTIPLRFYCLFTLFFVLANVVLSRDYGPMLHAEFRSLHTGQVLRHGAEPLATREFSELTAADGVPPRPSFALLPVGVVLLVMVVGFWFVGQGWPRFRAEGWASLTPQAFGETLDNAYNMQVAVVAAAAGSILAIALAWGSRALRLVEAIRAWVVGFRSLLLAVGILFSAWAMAEACATLSAGDYLVAVVGETIPLELFPVVIFLLACVVAFSTGTSWGTMAILLPISIPSVYAAEAHTGGGLGPLTLLSLGAVLEGSIFGDHCSPISDTTVLSSVASGSDHLDHVHTQIPYALTTMLIALVVGYVPVAYGVYPVTVALLLGAVCCVAVLLLFGTRLEDDDPQESAP